MSEVNFLRLQITNFIKKLNREYSLSFYIFPVMNYAAFDVTSGSFRKFQGEKGISDLILVAYGASFYVELKTEGDTQKKAQKEFQNKIEDAGAVYKIIRSLEMFVEFVFKIVLKEAIKFEVLKKLSLQNEV